MGVAPAVPTIVLATEKNPSIAVFRRYRVLNQEFMLSFTEDTFERKRNARETGTTTDTKEVEKASRYDESRYTTANCLRLAKRSARYIRIEGHTRAYGNFLKDVCGPK